MVYNGDGEYNMAKKKTSKEGDTKKANYSIELNGLLLILIGIIGFGGRNFGPVGRIIKDFAIFLLGSWYAVLLFLILTLGAYMVAKRKMPKFFSSRLIGFYILIIAVLVFSHITYVVDSGLNWSEVLQATIDNFGSVTSAGGIIGALFAVLFTKMFAVNGAKIVVYVLFGFGAIMLLDITLGDILEKLGLGAKWTAKKLKEGVSHAKDSSDDKVVITGNPDDDEEKEDDKIVITSVEELKTHPKEDIGSELHEVVTAKEEPINVNYQLPPLSLLDDPEKAPKGSTDFVKHNVATLERVMKDFQVKGKVVEIHIGPSITQYEIKIESGTKVSKLVSIKDELKLALAVKDIRIQAPIPGKNTIGIEIPNAVSTSVRVKDIIANIPKNLENAKLLAVLGKDIMGKNQYTDISRMPHLLVAGSTGSGKSVCINSMIASILMRYRPDEVKLVLVDPKKVELSNYNGVPHLLCPVVTDPKKASLALQKIVGEMDKRYDIFTEKGAKNIATYNEWVEKQNKRNPEAPLPLMPYILVIIDELADLMLVAAKEVEDSILRITQMARAAGIHLIVATQRPSTDIITGVVKANIPSRIAFAVSSNVDSRTILDMGGAERLIGKGDMLYFPMGENAPIRIQGSFISDAEIKRIIDYVCNEQKASYDESIITPTQETNTSAGMNKDSEEPLYDEIVEFAVKTGKVSASLIQRRFRLGYNRAARIIDLLEDRGIIGPMNGSKPREVLVKLEEKE